MTRLASAIVGVTLLGAALGSTPAHGAEPKVFRYAFRVAETGFDPAQISDVYSRAVAGQIFEAPLAMAFLARPVRLRPNTAVALPTVSDDFKTITLSIKPGIYFQDDPAFGGKPRELVAEDYVYAIKRHYDPRWKSASLYMLENGKLLGLSELRQEALASKKPFDYDRVVEGAKAVDRYTLRIQLGTPDPRFPYYLADPGFTGAVAREVVERYGDKIMEHPVGTGPFRLAQWKRSSKIVLEKNPTFREDFYDEDPPENDPVAVAFAKKLKGRRLPMVDRVEVSIVEENQPRWLAFINGEHDMVEEVPPEFAHIAMPNGELAPNLAKRDIRMVRYQRSDVAHSYFAMEHPIVGGYTPEKVALRRAISLAVDVDEEIRLVRRGQAVFAQGIVSPGVFGYDPSFRSEMSLFSRARAKALLDMYGYVDKNGDGWRELPDGGALVLEYSTQPDQLSRQLIEQWKKNMDAVGIRIDFKVAKWPENLKSSRAGKLMMWGLGWSATSPDADVFLSLAYGPNKGQSNHPRFDLPQFNAIYEKQRVLPDGPERNALILEAQKLLVAYMPYKVHVHRIFTDMAQPWVVGYHRNTFKRDFWKYVDIDVDELRKRTKR